MPALVFAFLIAALFLAMWLHNLHIEQRRATMALLAQEMGLDFSERDTFNLGNQLTVFELFRRNLFEWPNIRNLLPGALDDTEVFLFEYSFFVKKGRGQRLIEQTVFVAIDPDWQRPEFRYRHDRWYEAKLISRHRRSGPHGPIEFRSELLRAHETETSVRESLVPELQALLTELGAAHIEVSNGCLLIYRPAYLMSTDAARTFYEDCCALTVLLKSKATRHRVLQWAEWKGKDY